MYSTSTRPRLPAQDREVVSAAAVVGRFFSRAAVAALRRPSAALPT